MLNRTVRPRNGTIDIFRLLYAIVIMTGHSVTVGVTSPFPFEPVGILIEFFLFVTGYYTCVSFERRKEFNFDSYFDNAIMETYKKFKVFIPYLVISVGLSYSLNIISILQNGGGMRLLGRNLINMFSEMFLLNYAFSEVGQRVGALFYLAALFFVFPLFCVFVQLKNKSIKLCVALYAVVLYYHDTNVAVTATYPYVLLRIFSGLCAGVIIYLSITSFMENDVKKKIRTMTYRVMTVFLLLVPLILSGFQILDRRIALICEFTGLMLALSNLSDLNKRNNRITDWMAKLAMAIYILHWSVGQNINYYFVNESISFKIVLYYMITMCLSILMLLLVEFKRKWIRTEENI